MYDLDKPASIGWSPIVERPMPVMARARERSQLPSVRFRAEIA